MDMAQIARSLYLGRGFSTNIIRPISFIYLESFPFQPDIINPPIMPVIISLFFSIGGGTTDSMVAFASGFCFLISGFFVYYLSLKLLSRKVANLTLLLYFCNPLLLNYAISGTEMSLIVMMSLILFVFMFMFIEKRTNLLAAGLGILLGAMFLCRYWTVIFLIPVGFLVYRRAREENISKLLFMFFSFVAVVFPWWVRNAYLTGNPLFTLNSLGIRSFVTGIPFADFMRTPYLLPVGAINYKDILSRFISNLNWSYFDMLMLTRNFLISFAVMGLFMRFRNSNPILFSLRKYLFIFLFVHLFLSGFSAEIGEQLAIYIPFLTMLAVGFVFEIIDRLDSKRVSFKRLVIPVFILINLVPFLFSFFMPVKKNTVQTKNLLYLQSILDKDKITISDSPWLLAWVIDRPSLWLPSKDEDLNSLLDKLTPKQKDSIAFAYITSNILQYPFSEKESTWKRVYLKGAIPGGFYFPEGMFLPNREMLLGSAESFRAIKNRETNYFMNKL